MTSDELLRLNLPNKRTELIHGVLRVREPAAYRHGQVAARLARILGVFVDAQGLGDVLAAETGFKLFADPDTVRAPDVGFVCRARIPSPPPRGFPAMAPDLAAEVLSPDDRPAEVVEKVADWLDAGCRLVWVIDPDRGLARVYRADGTESFVPEHGALDGEDVVPGFSCPLHSVLQR
jgi:Uma2 family endonuclease